MNIRQNRYKANRLKGLSAYKSAMEAGYSKATAWNAHKNIEKRCNFEQWLIDAGLTDDVLAKHTEEGVKAEKLQSIAFKIVPVPDWGARHKFLETALKLRGKIVDKPMVDLSKHQHFTFQYDKIDENNIRTTQSPDGSLGISGKVESASGRKEIRKDPTRNPRANEEGTK